MNATLVATICFALPHLAAAAEIPKGGMVLISKNAGGAIANAPGQAIEISGNGKRIAFSTVASNLGPDTFNGFRQIVTYARDGALLGVASKNALGGIANLDCDESALSRTGRYVVFQTRSTMFVDGVAGGTTQVFRRDTTTGEVVLASVTSGGGPVEDGAEALDISDDGRFVVFSAYSTSVVPGLDAGAHRTYVRDLVKGKTILVSRNHLDVPLSDASYDAQISSNGRYVFFDSAAAELEGAPYLGSYVRDLKKGTTTLLSRRKNGEPANGSTEILGVSSNGRFVVMLTESTDLLPNLEEGGIVVLDRETKKMKPIDVSEPNLTITQIGGPAVIANDGSRLFVNVSYDGGMTFGTKSDLIEIDLATKERWTRFSLADIVPMGSPFELAGSANAEWIAVITDAKVTDSTGFGDTNDQRDAYLMRAN